MNGLTLRDLGFVSSIAGSAASTCVPVSYGPPTDVVAIFNESEFNRLVITWNCGTYTTAPAQIYIPLDNHTGKVSPNINITNSYSYGNNIVYESAFVRLGDGCRSWGNYVLTTIQPAARWSPSTTTVEWIDNGGTFNGDLAYFEPNADHNTVTDVTFDGTYGGPPLEFLNLRTDERGSDGGLFNLQRLIIDSEAIIGFVNLESFVNLNFLNISNTNAYLHDVYLAGCDSLENLYLDNNTSLTTFNNIHGLNDLSTLRILYVTYCGVNGSVGQLGCDSLEELNIESNAITDIDISNLSNLQIFNAKNNPLTDLTIGVVNSLGEVQLEGCSMSEGGVNALCDNLLSSGIQNGYLNMTGVNMPEYDSENLPYYISDLQNAGWNVDYNGEP